MGVMDNEKKFSKEYDEIMENLCMDVIKAAEVRWGGVTMRLIRPMRWE